MLHAVLRQHPGAGLAVEREHRDAVAHRQHQHRLRAVDAVAGGGLLLARLQEVLFADAAGVADLAQHREDGADRDVDVDVARAVERVVQQHVLALRVAVGHDVDRVHLLAGHRREVAAPFVGLDQHLVGDDVELLLHLALHVFAVGAAQHVAERALVDGDRDVLAGARDDLDQQPQLARDAAMFALLLDEVLGQADAFAHAASSACGDDLAHVVAQVGLGGDAGDGLVRRAAVGLGQHAPAVHHARQPRGHLRVQRVELEQPVGPEDVARGIAAVEGGRVADAQREDQAACAVRVLEREVRVLHQAADLAPAPGPPRRRPARAPGPAARTTCRSPARRP